MKMIKLITDIETNTPRFHSRLINIIIIHKPSLKNEFVIIFVYYIFFKSIMKELEQTKIHPWIL